MKKRKIIPDEEYLRKKNKEIKFTPWFALVWGSLSVTAFIIVAVNTEG